MIQDLRYAVRQLLRTPGFTIAAVVTLALGIGASTVVFAALNALIYRPMRSIDATGTYMITVSSPRREDGWLRLGQFSALESDPPASVQAAALMQPVVAIAHVPSFAERVHMYAVTAQFVDVFKIRMQRGRFFTVDEERSGARLAVISDRLWREWFGADPYAPGNATIRINSQSYTVIGVAPLGFKGHLGIEGTELWVSHSLWMREPRLGSGPSRMVSSGYIRLHPGATEAQAREETVALFSTMPFVQDPKQLVVRLDPAAGQTRVGIIWTRTMLGLGLLILLAACANLANMLYARGSRRVSEIAVRRASGASGGRIFRLFFSETFILTSAATALGLALAIGAARLFGRAFPIFQQRRARATIDLSPDMSVVLYALAIGVLASLLIGTASAWRASRITALHTLASGEATGRVSRRGRLLRLGLVAVQVTAALVLVMGATLFLQERGRSMSRTITYDTRPLASARIDLAAHGYNASRGRAFYERLARDVRSIDGVLEVAITDGLPGADYLAGLTATFSAEKERSESRDIAKPLKRVNGSIAAVSPGFLRTLDLPILHGRDFNDGDRDGAELVAIVSQTTANGLWPGADPLGKRLMIGRDLHWRTVIGVSPDPITVPADSAITSGAVYVPHDQRYAAEVLIVVRADAPESRLARVRQAVAAIDPSVAVFDLARVDNAALSSATALKAAKIAVGALGLVALGIALVGVYGVLSFLVSVRTREFGVRMALGAHPGQIVRMVLDEAVHLMLVGLLAGVIAVTWMERLLDYRLFGFMPNAILTWVVVPPALLAVGVLAAFIPARRAAAIDPNVALRDL